ncbi:MAG: C25 family cysteine peptidase [Candidatus Zixiibacteriota bacterium]
MRRSKLTIGAWLAIACFVFFAQPVYAEDSYQVGYTAEFSLDELEFYQTMAWDMVRLTDGSHLAELGKPMLPAKEIRIALPAGMVVTGVQIVGATQEEIPGRFDIFPAQPPRKVGSPDEEVEFVEPDLAVYSSIQPYPSEPVEFVRQTDLVGQGMAIVRLYPVRYVPGEKRLTLYTSVTLVIEGTGGYECGDYLSPNASQRNRQTYKQMTRDMVENPEEVQLNAAFKLDKSMAPPGGPFDHVIITSSLYASSFQPLVDWHTQKGVKDTVITTTWIYSNYAGADSQKIRNFISDANSSWGTAYFLLGGEHETIPFAYRQYSDEVAASDQYYSDFDDDWTHEVFVGRATVGNATEVNTFVGKVLKYEKDPPRTDYPLDALLLGMDYDGSTPVEELKESIDFGSIPARFNVTKVYDSHASNHKTAFINALNAGQNLVNHADHSYIEYMGTGDRNHGWGIVSSDVDALYNNDQLSVIVSPGCHPNHMDFNDCIAEHFVIYNPMQGGVAFNGNTRSGWYYSGNPVSLSNALDKQWWVALFFWGKNDLGQVLAEAKHRFGSSSTAEKQCEWTFNLLGEPEMPIWTDEPDSFIVVHPNWLPPEPSSFSVHVENATTGTPVNQAYVCLWKGDEVYLTGYTDPAGDVSFNPSPSTLGTMYVTVTKHNYLPHEEEADVREYLVGDPNGDGVINVADIVYMVNYLYRSGVEPDPTEAGDATCDGVVDVADVVYLVNYLYRGGPEPSC